MTNKLLPYRAKPVHTSCLHNHIGLSEGPKKAEPPKNRSLVIV